MLNKEKIVEETIPCMWDSHSGCSKKIIGDDPREGCLLCLLSQTMHVSDDVIQMALERGVRDPNLMKHSIVMYSDAVMKLRDWASKYRPDLAKPITNEEIEEELKEVDGDMVMVTRDGPHAVSKEALIAMLRGQDKGLLPT